MTRYSLAIINDCERPEPRMIALVRESDGVTEWTYISASGRHAGSRWLKWNTLQFPKHITPVERFGVKPVIELRDGDYVIGVEKAGRSYATYNDGKPRKWQAPMEDRTVIRAGLVPALRQWQRAPAIKDKAGAL